MFNLFGLGKPALNSTLNQTQRQAMREIARNSVLVVHSTESEISAEDRSRLAAQEKSIAKAAAGLDIILERLKTSTNPEQNTMESLNIYRDAHPVEIHQRTNAYADTRHAGTPPPSATLYFLNPGQSQYAYYLLHQAADSFPNSDVIGLPATLLPDAQMLMNATAYRQQFQRASDALENKGDRFYAISISGEDLVTALQSAYGHRFAAVIQEPTLELSQENSQQLTATLNRLSKQIRSSQRDLS